MQRHGALLSKSLVFGVGRVVSLDLYSVFFNDRSIGSVVDGNPLDNFRFIGAAQSSVLFSTFFFTIFLNDFIFKPF